MRLISLLFLVSASASASAQPTVSDLLEQKTVERIAKADAALDGVLGVAAIDLTTGRTLTYHADAVFPTASTIKVPVMIQLFTAIRAGDVRLTDQIPVSVNELVEESPVVEKAAKSTGKITVRELLEGMMQVSDNTATNKLIELVGMANVNRSMGELGFPQTRLRRRMIDLAAARRNEENVSTPIEMARLMEAIYRGKVLDEKASREMLEVMTPTKADVRKVIPAGIRVASKPGSLDSVKCEVAVVYLDKRPFVVSVYGTYLKGNLNPIGTITAILFDYYERLAKSNVYGRGL
jgi:beta-lactamase class A